MGPIAAILHGVGAALTIIVGAAFLLVASETRAAEDGSVRCRVEERIEAGSFMIQGIAEADAPVSGDFDFVVVSEDHGNSSTTRQGGSFALVPGEETILGVVVVDDDSYQVSLRLHVDGRTIDCSRRA